MCIFVFNHSVTSPFFIFCRSGLLIEIWKKILEIGFLGWVLLHSFGVGKCGFYKYKECTGVQDGLEKITIMCT